MSKLFCLRSEEIRVNSRNLSINSLASDMHLDLFDEFSPFMQYIFIIETMLFFKICSSHVSHRYLFSQQNI